MVTPIIRPVNPEVAPVSFALHVDNDVGWCYNHHMARPQRNEMATKQLASAVTRLHKHKPATAKDIELWSYANLGMRVSEESVRKALRGAIDPMQCSAELLLALAAFFGVSPDELGHIAAERVRPFLAYATNYGPDGGGDLRIAKSRCTAQASDELATVTALRFHQPAFDLEEAA